MDIQHLSAQLRQFAADRDWEQFHSPKNLAMALAVEASELLELFQWLTEEESRALRHSPTTRPRPRRARRHPHLPRPPRRQARHRPRSSRPRQDPPTPRSTRSRRPAAAPPSTATSRRCASTPAARAVHPGHRPQPDRRQAQARLLRPLPLRAARERGPLLAELARAMGSMVEHSGCSTTACCSSTSCR